MTKHCIVVDIVYDIVCDIVYDIVLNPTIHFFHLGQTQDIAQDIAFGITYRIRYL